MKNEIGLSSQLKDFFGFTQFKGSQEAVIQNV